MDYIEIDLIDKCTCPIAKIWNEGKLENNEIYKKLSTNKYPIPIWSKDKFIDDSN